MLPIEWPTTLIGRDVEFGLLSSAYQRATQVGPRLISIIGQAGIGKTALVRAFSNAQQSATILAASGDESEITLRFGVVGQLLCRLPVPIPQAIEGLTTGQPVEYDSFMVGALVLDTLGKLEHRGPVMLVVEDLHWIDSDSQQALAFAFRRLARSSSLLLLLTLREENLVRVSAAMRRLLEDEHSTRLVLSGLSLDASIELARSAGVSLPVATMRRLHEHTGGNPLHLKALLQEWEPGELGSQGAQLLPAPNSYAEIVDSRLRRCGPSGRGLVEAASVLGIRCQLEQAVRIANVRDPLSAMDEAAAAGLCRWRDDRLGRELEFDHPMTRAAVYHSLSLERRSMLHSSAASVVNDQRVALSHEAAASEGPNPDLAVRLKAAARDHLLRNDSGAAAADLLLAARVSANRREREECVLDAIDSYLLAGDPEAAGWLTGELETCSPSARRDYVLARLRYLAGQTNDAQALFRLAWNQLSTGDDELAARIAGWQAVTLLNSGLPRDAITWAERALTGGSVTLMPAGAATLALLDAHSCCGDFAAVMNLTADLPRHGLEIGPEQLERLVGRATARLWGDRVEDAVQDLTRAVDLARTRGVAYLLVVSLALLADAEYRRGRWDDAIAHGELSASIAAAADMQPIAGAPHAIASFAYSARGCWSQAERLVRSAEATALSSTGDLVSTSYAASARARLELMKGHPSAAAKALESTVRDGREPLKQPGIQPWELLYAEALYELGDLDAMRPILDRVEVRIRERNLSSLQTVVQRLRGQLLALVESTTSAKAVFEVGLAEADGTAAPFEYARLQLAYGSLLRRLGHRRAAKAHLESAREQLRLLGAAPMFERCEQELAGTGLRPRRRTVDERNVLTSRELTIARLVATAKSNREIADQLFVSEKTVEYHLSNVFSKLGFGSRKQLIRHWMEEDSTRH